MTAKQKDNRIKHVRREFSANKELLRRQVSHTELRPSSFEDRLILEILARMVSLDILPSRPAAIAAKHSPN